MARRSTRTPRGARNDEGDRGIVARSRTRRAGPFGRQAPFTRISIRLRAASQGRQKGVRVGTGRGRPVRSMLISKHVLVGSDSRLRLPRGSHVKLSSYFDDATRVSRRRCGLARSGDARLLTRWAPKVPRRRGAASRCRRRSARLVNDPYAEQNAYALMVRLLLQQGQAAEACAIRATRRHGIGTRDAWGGAHVAGARPCDARQVGGGPRFGRRGRVSDSGG